MCIRDRSSSHQLIDDLNDVLKRFIAGIRAQSGFVAHTESIVFKTPEKVTKSSYFNSRIESVEIFQEVGDSLTNCIENKPMDKVTLKEAYSFERFENGLTHMLMQRGLALQSLPITEISHEESSKFRLPGFNIENGLSQLNQSSEGNKIPNPIIINCGENKKAKDWLEIVKKLQDNYPAPEQYKETRVQNFETRQNYAKSSEIIHHAREKCQSFDLVYLLLLLQTNRPASKLHQSLGLMKCLYERKFDWPIEEIEFDYNQVSAEETLEKLEKASTSEVVISFALRALDTKENIWKS
eukprot:TRINITY_DN18163_c0_g1_i1.p1 TRINITY_DN18163_c0_g1~~TRINITY_DN18163_c0_g1_i1.p1  ORF type:complete len:296 (+),score=58.01 TRINITY_DN18163_c0_g1_i1:62-949(+)